MYIGNIKVENESAIEFETSKGVLIEASADDGDDTTQNADCELKVTKDGVEISTSDGNNLVVNDVLYENAGSAQDNFALVVNPNGDVMLKDGATTVPTGNKIGLPSGLDVISQNGNMTVTDDGTLSIPTSGTEVSITTGNGKTHNYTTTEDNVVIQCPADQNIPVLDEGTVILPKNMKVTIVPKNSNDIIITIDGENSFYNDILKIETYVDEKRISCLRRKDYDFAKKINEKFLK